MTEVNGCKQINARHLADYVKNTILDVQAGNRTNYPRTIQPKPNILISRLSHLRGFATRRSIWDL